MKTTKNMKKFNEEMFPVYSTEKNKKERQIPKKTKVQKLNSSKKLSVDIQYLNKYKRDRSPPVSCKNKPMTYTPKVHSQHRNH